MHDPTPDFSVPIEPDLSSEPAHRVSLWEMIAITMGAGLLVAAGLLGLGVKALGNAFNPERAEAIAQSLMRYEVAGGSQGFFGANIGGGKMAVVASNRRVPESLPESQLPVVELFLARMPLPEAAKTKENAEPGTESEPVNELFSGFSFSNQDVAAFEIDQAETEQKAFCGTILPVEVSTGLLLQPNGASALPAVKYELIQPLETESRIVVISALGADAAEQAKQTFAALKCLDATR